MTDKQAYTNANGIMLVVHTCTNKTGTLVGYNKDQCYAIVDFGNKESGSDLRYICPLELDFVMPEHLGKFYGAYVKHKHTGVEGRVNKIHPQAVTGQRDTIDIFNGESLITGNWPEDLEIIEDPASRKAPACSVSASCGTAPPPQYCKPAGIERTISISDGISSIIIKKVELKEDDEKEKERAQLSFLTPYNGVIIDMSMNLDAHQIERIRQFFYY